jgi:hypothetical protein
VEGEAPPGGQRIRPGSGRHASVELRERGRHGRGGGVRERVRVGGGLYTDGGVRLDAFWLSDPIRRPVEEAHLFGPACK